MKERRDEGFVFWIFKSLLVSGPLALAETVFNLVEKLPDMKTRALIYSLIVSLVMLLVLILRLAGSERIP